MRLRIFLPGLSLDIPSPFPPCAHSIERLGYFYWSCTAPPWLDPGFSPELRDTSCNVTSLHICSYTPTVPWLKLVPKRCCLEAGYDHAYGSCGRGWRRTLSGGMWIPNFRSGSSSSGLLANE
jgi:hypothetical protein